MAGLGSIGQRHVRNIRRVMGEEAEIIAFRSRGLKTTFDDSLNIREGVDLEEEYSIRSFTDLDEALSEKPDAAFITNITAKHMETALRCARAGCHIFMEKPLSDSFEGVEEFRRTVREKGLKFFTGFQNRYHPCVALLKEYIESGALGKIGSARVEFSERLTTMHRYEDYRGTYMARKDMGGGPVMNLMMHDLDMLAYLLGKPVSVFGRLGFDSGLSIDVEERADALFEFEGGVNVSAHTDFLQYPPFHHIKIVGDKGRIEANFNTAKVLVYDGGENGKLTEFEQFVRNDMFISELKDFIDCIENDKEPVIGIEDGILALKMGLAIKHSHESGAPVEL